MIEIPRPEQDGLGYKACCAALYESDAIRFLLGESMRPGGVALTRQAISDAGLPPGARVLDVACGTADARAAVESFGATYFGVDLGVRWLSAAGYGRLAAAEAEHLPFGDVSFEGLLVQCAFCTFADKPGAATEIARVLRPGGRLILADVTLDCDALPPELDSVFAAAACLADARPMARYAGFAEDVGLRVRLTRDCPEAAMLFLRGIDQKLLLARVAQAAGALDLGSLDLASARQLLKLTMQMVERGELSYGYLIAQKAG